MGRFELGREQRGPCASRVGRDRQRDNYRRAMVAMSCKRVDRRRERDRGGRGVFGVKWTAGGGRIRLSEATKKGNRSFAESLSSSPLIFFHIYVYVIHKHAGKENMS